VSIDIYRHFEGTEIDRNFGSFTSPHGVKAHKWTFSKNQLCSFGSVFMFRSQSIAVLEQFCLIFFTSVGNS
jgi:hypothetical protein